MAQRINIDIIARDKSRQALGAVQKSLGRLKQSIFNVQNAFIGLGAGLVVRNLVNTGKELENLRVRLKFLLKDTNEGTKAFENMTKFASKVPFSLEQIQAGAGILASVTDNADDLQDMLEITGNVAATTGLDFFTAAEQIQRSFSAGIGAADLFREKGVRNMLGFQAGATVSIEETVKAFEKVFARGGRFGSATDELAKTFTGTLSMIGDKVFNFKKVLLEAGFFDELKKQFGDLDTFLENNARDLDRIAIAVGKNLAQGMRSVVQIGKDLIPTLKSIGNILKDIIDGFMALPEFVRTGGIIGAFLFGKKGLAALAGVSFVVDKINTMIKGIKTSMGIFDIENLDDVNLRMAQIKREMEELTNNRIFLEVEGGVVDDNRLDILYKELEALEKQKQYLKDSVNLRNGNLPNLRDEFKIVQGIVKEKEKVVELTAREKGIIENSKQQLTGFEHVLRQINSERLRELQDKFANVQTIIAQGINDGITKMSQGLARSIVFAKDIGETFKNMARTLLANVLSALIEIVARKGVELAIEKLITREKQKQAALDSARGGASFFSAVGGFFSGRASGGSVQKGMPYVVGEKGAELFIPNQSGQITQSARGTGGKATTVNFNINTLDASGFEDLLVRSRGTITSIINNAVNERGERALI